MLDLQLCPLAIAALGHNPNLSQRFALEAHLETFGVETRDVAFCDRTDDGVFGRRRLPLGLWRRGYGGGRCRGCTRLRRGAIDGGAEQITGDGFGWGDRGGSVVRRLTQRNWTTRESI